MSLASADNLFADGNLGLTDEEAVKFAAAWRSIPADRRPAYDAAFWAICAANGTNTPPPPWIETEAGRVYWAAGYADRIIAAVDSFADCFTDGDRIAAVDAIQRIADWFKAKGVIVLYGRLSATLADANAAHNAGLALHQAQDAAARAKGNRR